jgi:endonuclease/exonuclease/phosphatase family metal-dependent hydrolase
MKHSIRFALISMLALCLTTTASDTAPPQLRVLTYNIHHGEGVDGKLDCQRLANIVTRVNPDIVALQEVDRKTSRVSGIDEAALLGKLTGLRSIFGSAMPFSGGEYGQAILSRFPMSQTKTHALPSEGHEPRIMLATKIMPNNGLPELLFAGTHLCHQSEALRVNQGKEINRILPQAEECPVILAGDFNARKGSAAMNTFLDKRWIDATINISRIDYILLRPDDPWRVVETQTIDEPIASDHKPVLAVLEWTGARSSNAKQTCVSIKKDKWFINGNITYPGAEAQGLLMNMRAVNATFEDRNKPEFKTNENTDHFLKALPGYITQGVRAFTLNLQGGMPGYEGAINSAFNPDGSLRAQYLQRIERVINACDQQGCVVILGCFYQRQDQILRDETAVRHGLINVLQWIEAKGFTNVVLEIANEFPHGGFNHPILKTPQGQVKLIKLAKKRLPNLLVSTSGVGNGRMFDIVAEASDFMLPHYNGTSLADIPKRIKDLKRFGKPILCNEDDKTGKEAARAAELSVKNGASWGYMNKEVNQYTPFEFNGAQDDLPMYEVLQKLTSVKN